MQQTAPLTLGDMTVQRIVEMEFPFRTPGELYIDATDEAIDRHRHWLEPWALDPASGRIILAVQSYLLRTRHHTILIDTCVGCDKTSTFLPAWHRRSDRGWLARLTAAGVRPEAVDYVLCTHLHSDHCGWNTQLVDGRWVPTFPNARYVLARREVAHQESLGTPSFAESVLPILEAGQAQLVDTDFALDDQVWLEPTPGHTPGHVAVGMASGGAAAVMSGDLMHSPLQCALPDWRYRIDSDPEEANRTRRRFLESNESSGRLVLTAHFPSPSMGRIVAADDAFRFDFV